MALTDPTQHQVSESIPLNCAIAGEHPLNIVTGDNGVSFRCRTCSYSTSVLQIRATPSVPNADQSRWGPDAKQTSGATPLLNEEGLLSTRRPFALPIS
jgi:hypothetical protein